MHKSNKEPLYPDNLTLKGEVVKNRMSVTDIAGAIGISRKVVSDTLNGHYKGENIIPLIKAEITKQNNISLTNQ